MLKTVFICLLVIYGFIYLILAVGTKKPFKTIVLYAFMGVATLTMINLTSKFSGVYIPVNAYTLGSSAALGLPGTIGLLFLRIIFMG